MQSGRSASIQRAGGMGHDPVRLSAFVKGMHDPWLRMVVTADGDEAAVDVEPPYVFDRDVLADLPELTAAIALPRTFRHPKQDIILAIGS
jgi:hypothetical protein